jgi:hypothetical protein
VNIGKNSLEQDGRPTIVFAERQCFMRDHPSQCFETGAHRKSWPTSAAKGLLDIDYLLASLRPSMCICVYPGRSSEYSG